MGLMKRSKISLKIKDFTDAYIFQADVTVLWVVWKSIPRPIIWCSAPVVPILMLTTVSNDTRLQKKMPKKKDISSTDTSDTCMQVKMFPPLHYHVEEETSGTVHENLIL